jgi:DNA mismatch repair ATPase MutS
VVFLIAFVVLIVYDNGLKRHLNWYYELVKINDEGRSRLARDWEALPKPDDIPADPDHPFADDLDLFGHASLFSLLGTVATPLGRDVLRRWLLEPANRQTILERQAAVAELAPPIDVREEITATGRTMPSAGAAALEGFLTWAEGDPWLRPRPYLAWAARLLSLAPAVLIILNVAGLVSWRAWVGAAILNIAFTFTAGTGVHRTFGRAFARENEFQGYARLLGAVAQSRFSCSALTNIQAELSQGHAAAQRQMKKLHRLLALAEVRYSMTYMPIQAFTLWDFHVLWRLERWQLTYGRHARRWLEALAEFDALAALAGLCYENPDWAFPQITDVQTPTLEATGLGHPLLPDGVRVVNDVKVGPPGSFLFVTGSNMSGKSTLLRAIGTNTVLARAGAPVCASSMRLPPLILETSMRVHDSLQQGLSHFMAELTRLKGVVEAARNVRRDGNGTLLYLLDDVLQGTNTAERRIAARKIIGHLLAEGAIGGVTSHDLALADTDELSAACDPVHFSERIHETAEGPSISFDYRLRPGIATSKNALKLLEIVGLDEPLAKGGPTAESK